MRQECNGVPLRQLRQEGAGLVEESDRSASLLLTKVVTFATFMVRRKKYSPSRLKEDGVAFDELVIHQTRI